MGGKYLGGGNSCTGEYAYSFNGQEKSDEFHGEGNPTTAQFWEYDTRLARRWNLDPVPQISISDYAVFGLNPIVNVDIKGDDWETAEDEEIVGRIKEGLQSRSKQYYRKSSRQYRRALKAEKKGNDKRAERIFEKSEESHAIASSLNNAINELDQIDDSETVFTFIKNEGGAGFISMNENGVVEIASNTDANRVHELKHGYQFITDKLELIPGGFSKDYDLQDEVEAYTRQFYFDPESVKNIDSKDNLKVNTIYDINFNWIRSLYYLDDNNNKVFPFENLEGIKRY